MKIICLFCLCGGFGDRGTKILHAKAAAYPQRSSVRADVSFLVASPICWEPPLSGWFKLNCDAAIKAQWGMVSYRTVIRSHEGLVMLAGADIGVYSHDMIVVEAEVVCFGLWLAREVCLFRLIIESESLYVTQLIQGQQTMRTDLFG